MQHTIRLPRPSRPCRLAGAFIATLGLAHAQSVPAWYLTELGPGLPDAAAPASDVQTADFDLDGHLDLLFHAAGGCRLMLGDALSRFTILPGALPTTVGDGVGPLQVGDVDGDGDVDAIVSTAQGNQVVKNDGTGHFGSAATFVIPTFQSQFPPRSTLLVDVTGDGILDFVQTSLSLRLHRGLGNGTFVLNDITLPSAGAGGVFGLNMADLDGDGDNDLVLLGSSAAVIVRQNPGATFAVVQSLPAAFAIAPGDVDGDGDTDLLRTGFTGTQVHLNNGNATFAAGQSLSFPMLTDLADGALADVDGDGDLDALMGFSLLHNDGSGNFTLAGPVPGLANFAVGQVVDLDGDQDVDVVAASASFGKRLAWNSGGTLTLVTNTVPARVADDRSIADMDGDGDLDVVDLGFAASGITWLYRNDGWGGFTVGGTPVLSPLVSTLAYALGDLDGDTLPDAVFGGFGPGFLFVTQVLGNDGTGQLVPVASGYSGIAGPTNDVLLADLDADADLDAFLASGLSTSSRVARNDGTGMLTDDPGALPPTALGTVASGADFDLDGDLDLLLAGSSALGASARALLINDGTGHFQEVAATHLPVLPPGARVLVGDLDADGDADAYVLAYLDPGVNTPVPVVDALLQNDGTAHFVNAAAQLPALAYRPHTAVLADVDGDGDDDLVRGNGAVQVFSSEVTPAQVFVNNGAANFTLSSLPVLPAGLRLAGEALAAADLDRDGDVDLVGDSGFLARSLVREIAPVNALATNRPFGIELWSAGAATSYLLLLGTGDAALSAPPYGTLGIDPTGPFLTLPPLPLGAISPTLFEVFVPNQPGLVGITIHWQALMQGGAPHLTRRFRSLVSD